MKLSLYRRGEKAPPLIYKTPAGERSLLYSDMLKQPHLLIAGATGSGKSVVINALLYTMLFKPPGNIAGGANYILVDPKRVELWAFHYTPHSLFYASEPGEISNAFDYALSICENRFLTMRYNGLKMFPGGDIYMIIDEFADLMTTQRKQVMPKIQRLAQIGRAARIHIILATQTPISKVLPTEIKVNFDARLALRTRSAQDSRNIIGKSGCELFPRYGQGYYMTPEGENIYNLPMYTENEITARVDWWKVQTNSKMPLLK